MKNPNKVRKNNWRVTPLHIKKIKVEAKLQKISESNVIRNLIDGIK